jgi:hypothetical protein
MLLQSLITSVLLNKKVMQPNLPSPLNEKTTTLPPGGQKGKFGARDVLIISIEREGGGWGRGIRRQDGG